MYKIYIKPYFKVKETFFLYIERRDPIYHEWDYLRHKMIDKKFLTTIALCDTLLHGEAVVIDLQGLQELNKKISPKNFYCSTCKGKKFIQLATFYTGCPDCNNGLQGNYTFSEINDLTGESNEN